MFSKLHLSAEVSSIAEKYGYRNKAANLNATSYGTCQVNFEIQVSLLDSVLWSVGIYQITLFFDYCNCKHILFTKLPWPGDSEGVLQSSSQAATCSLVYLTLSLFML